MKVEYFNFAIRIITFHHTSEIIINYTEPNGQVKNDPENPTLHIKNCCASVVRKLMENGYSLSMNNGLMSVNKY